jgi:hypothetical protein
MVVSKFCCTHCPGSVLILICLCFLFPDKSFSFTYEGYSAPGKTLSFESAKIPSKGSWTFLAGGGYGDGFYLNSIDGPEGTFQISHSLTKTISLSASYNFFQEQDIPSVNPYVSSIHIGGLYSPAIFRQYAAPRIGIAYIWSEGGTSLAIDEGVCLSIPSRVFTPFLSAGFFTSVPIDKKQLPVGGSKNLNPLFTSETYTISTTFGPQINLGFRFEIPAIPVKTAFYLMAGYSQLFAKKDHYYGNDIFMSGAGGIAITF